MMVDENTCTGYGLCVETCPMVFDMDGDAAVAKAAIVPPEAEESCREAVEGCPVEAISIGE